MQALFYQYLTRAAKLLGPWFFILVAKTVATGYFLMDSRRRSISRDFYATLFSNRSQPYHYWAAWKQFCNFTHVYLDRFLQREVRDLEYTIQGREHVVTAHQRQKGGILLMSHMGNWEIAAHLLTKILPELRLLLYMGIRNEEEIEKIQKQSVRGDGVRVIAVDQNEDSPFNIVDGMRFLKEGGFVSMAGDLTWHADQRTITGTFLHRRVQIPEAPFALSLVSGAPVIVFFAFRTQTGHYRFTAHQPIQVTAPTRADRSSAIQKAVQTYLSYLEAALHQHPFEWYHFDAFLEHKRDH